MIDDPFYSQTTLERIPLQGVELYYLPRILLPHTAEAVMKQLIDKVPWRTDNIVVCGKTYPQPRLTAWYGDDGADYTYSGIHLKPLPWTHTLIDIKNRVEKIAGIDFNSVLLNYYRDHRDSMGLHSDDEPELGRRPIIASVSLGEERAFILKHKSRRDLKTIRLKLTSGSLLLMKGETQHHWKHGIEKARRPCGPRVNLTFRRIF